MHTAIYSCAGGGVRKRVRGHGPNGKKMDDDREQEGKCKEEVRQSIYSDRQTDRSLRSREVTVLREQPGVRFPGWWRGAA